MSKIKDFREKDIRSSIIAKGSLGKINKNSKHWKADIVYKGILVGKVKIPNDHDRIMHSSKSQYIAAAMRLDEEQFNQFVECSLKAHEYEAIISLHL